MKLLPNNILKSCDFFYKLAGLMEFPPVMKEKIMNIIDGSHRSYLDWILKNGEQNFPPQGMGHTTTINVDLAQLPARYKPDILIKDNNQPIQVVILIVDANKLPGDYKIMNHWDYSNRRFLFTLVMANMRFDRNNISDIVEHELTHMLQTFIDNSIRKNKNLQIERPILKRKPGYPSQWRPRQVYEPATKEYREHGSKYQASGVEFFPQLRQNINEALRGGHTKYDFKRFVLYNNFMKNLKEVNPNLYERAVSEAWKAFQKVLDTDPVKEKSAKIKFGISEMLSNYDKDILTYAKEQLSKSGAPSNMAVITFSNAPDFIKKLINLILISGGGEGMPVSHIVFEKEEPARIIFSIIIAGKKVMIIRLKDNEREQRVKEIRDYLGKRESERAVELLNKNKTRIIEYASSIGFGNAKSIFEAPPFLQNIILTLTSLYEKPSADFFLFRKNKDQSVSAFIISEKAPMYSLFKLKNK